MEDETTSAAMASNDAGAVRALHAQDTGSCDFEPRHAEEDATLRASASPRYGRADGRDGHRWGRSGEGRLHGGVPGRDRAAGRVRNPIAGRHGDEVTLPISGRRHCRRPRNRQVGASTGMSTRKRPSACRRSPTDAARAERSPRGLSEFDRAGSWRLSAERHEAMTKGPGSFLDAAGRRRHRRRREAFERGDREARSRGAGASPVHHGRVPRHCLSWRSATRFGWSARRRSSVARWSHKAIRLPSTLPSPCMPGRRSVRKAYERGNWTTPTRPSGQEEHDAPGVSILQHPGGPRNDPATVTRLGLRPGTAPFDFAWQLQSTVKSDPKAPRFRIGTIRLQVSQRRRTNAGGFNASLLDRRRHAGGRQGRWPPDPAEGENKPGRFPAGMTAAGLHDSTPDRLKVASRPQCLLGRTNFNSTPARNV